MSRTRYILARTGYTVLLLIAVLTMLFFFFRMLPGDYTDLMVYQGASQESVAAFKQKWGLNDPLTVQYWRYIVNFIQGDVGNSLASQQPVLDFVRVKLFNSFILVAPAITVGYIIGAVLGAIFARADSIRVENWGLPLVILAGSFPSFFLALVLIIVFAGILNWFPTSGMVSYSAVLGADTPWWKLYTTKDFAIHYALPFSTIVLRYLYTPTLIMRTSMNEILDQDFTFYHRVTGLSEYSQLKHLMRHSLLPVITLYPVSMTRAIGGLVLIEKVFNWPGIGTALINSVLARDYPVVQFIFFLVAAFVIISNFAVDIIYGAIDPRISVGDD